MCFSDRSVFFAPEVMQYRITDDHSPNCSSSYLPPPPTTIILQTGPKGALKVLGTDIFVFSQVVVGYNQIDREKKILLITV